MNSVKASEDFESLCILCGERKGSINTLMSLITDEKVLLFDAFVFVTCLDISDRDKYPKKMCSICMSRLRDAYLLKKDAERYYERFKNFKYENNSNDDEESSNSFEEYERVVKTEIAEATELELTDSNCIDSSTDAVEFLSSENKVSYSYIELPRKQRNKLSLEDKKHECQVCHKKFLRKSNLVDHLRLHANMKLFKCEYCDKAFVQSGNYKSHIRIHTNERPYSCPVCSKSYNQSSALKIHIRTHTNERNYVCDICTKAFTNSSDLTKHKRVHDPNKQFKCSFCKRTFAQKVNLKLHQNNTHPESVFKVQESINKMRSKNVTVKINK